MLSADQIVNNASCLSSAGGLQEFLCGWQGTMGLALTTSAVFLAAFYIISVLFRNEGLKGFVKLELSELFITVVLVMILIGAMGAVSDLQFGGLLSQNQIPGIAPTASIYNVTQREMSSRLLGDKMKAVAATGASEVATANPGCMLQLEAGLRRHGVPGTVAHVVEVLDEAYTAGDAGRAAVEAVFHPPEAETGVERESA